MLLSIPGKKAKEAAASKPYCSTKHSAKEGWLRPPTEAAKERPRPNSGGTGG